ncbi:hypothetical protein BGZ91_010518, partial [Linnemannia elongata]
MSSSQVPHWLKPVACLGGSLCLLALVASAQPISTCGMAYGTANETTLYVFGGAQYTGGNVSNATTQLYALDLTQTGWSTSNPPWTIIWYPTSFLPIVTSRFQYSMSLSPENTILSLWGADGDNMLNKYYIGGDFWESTTIVNTVFGAGLSAVTDPTTGLVYFSGGGASYSDMKVFDPNTELITSAPSSSSVVTGNSYYSFVWSSWRNSFIYFTGDVGAVNPLYEFTPSTGQWGQMAPGYLRSYPATSVEKLLASYGTKMILFGGDDNSVSTSNLYILDVPTMTWSRATSASEARSGMACAVSGERFVVWGEYHDFISQGFEALDSTTRIGVSTVPLIYNLY